MRTAILPLLLCAAGSIQAAAPRVETRTEPLAMGAKLWVDQGDGKVEVTGWDRPEVELVAEFIPGRGGREVKLDVQRMDGGLKILVDRPRTRSFFVFNFGRHVEPKVNLTLKVPRKLLMAVRTVDGPIRVQSLEGYADCHTVDGNIEVQDVAGEVHARAVDGNITGRQLRARVKAHAVDGRITLQKVDGGLDLGTVDGSITAEDLDGWGEGITCKTVDGRIRVRLGQAKGVVDAKSLDASITSKVPGLAYDAPHHHLTGTVPGRTQKISLHTVDGAIEVE